MTHVLGVISAWVLVVVCVALTRLASRDECVATFYAGIALTTVVAGAAFYLTVLIWRAP